MKYRKKPVIVEAIEMTKERRASNADWPSWMHEAWTDILFPSEHPNSDGTDKLAIHTTEGIMIVEWGDYIIQGTRGELYPCKPGPFADTFEAVTDSKIKGSTNMQTALKIVNKTKDDVMIWLTLGATPGCLQDVTQIPWITSGSNLMGSFNLKANSEVSYTSLLGLNGNLTAGGPPLNCPTDKFPGGINIFEFIINNGFQAGNPQETIDISCVAGVNALWSGALSGGGKWNAGSTMPDVKIFYNDVIGNNAGLVGVYPFGCDDCIESVAPPVCNPILQPETPQSEPICNIQRDADKGGGTVTANFLGLLAIL